MSSKVHCHVFSKLLTLVLMWMSRHMRRQETRNREIFGGEQNQSDLKVLQAHMRAREELGWSIKHDLNKDLEESRAARLAGKAGLKLGWSRWGYSYDNISVPTGLNWTWTVDFSYRETENFCCHFFPQVASLFTNWSLFFWGVSSKDTPRESHPLC